MDLEGSGHSIIADDGVCLEALEETKEIVSDWNQCPT
jgi:hypothetical protein